MRWLIFLDTGPPERTCAPGTGFRRGRPAMGEGNSGPGPGARGRPCPRFSRAFEAAGIPVRLLRERFRFDPAIIGQFRRALDKFKPDVYQSHGYKGSMLAASPGAGPSPGRRFSTVLPGKTPRAPLSRPRRPWLSAAPTRSSRRLARLRPRAGAPRRRPGAHPLGPQRHPTGEAALARNPTRAKICAASGSATRIPSWPA